MVGEQNLDPREAGIPTEASDDLTYALAIGVSCMLGTLLPPLLAGTLGQALSSVGSQYVVGGVLLGGAAMVATGWAGFCRDFFK